MPNEEFQLLAAEYVAPMNGPVIRDAAVVFGGGVIAAVGPPKRLRAEYPHAHITELGQAVILPGLVNAHTHLELSDCQCGERPNSGFAGWLVGMLQRTAINPEEMEIAVTKAIEIGVRQCLRFGVTAVGDISRQSKLTRRLLRKLPLRVVSYGEVMAMAQRRHFLEERLAVATDATDAGERLTIGLTPHSPYSIEPAGYARCLEMARAANLPLATHLAETRDEAAFLADHSGPLRELWNAWLSWDDQVPTFTGGPIRYAQSLGLLDYPTLLAHVNYADDDELRILSQGQASVVYCPRTHEYFGHPPHRWREMLARGINVALGTDSCASSPDLNLLDDLRLVHRLAPEVEPAELWKLVTTNAAAAVEQAHRVGDLRAGSNADFAVFNCKGTDPLREILESNATAAEVWVDGCKCDGTDVPCRD